MKLLRPLLVPCLLSSGLAVIAGCNGGGGGTTAPNDLALPGPQADLAMAPVKDMAMPVMDMAMPGPCDTVKQDCPKNTDKCTTVVDPNDPMGTALIPQCLAVTGMVGLGGTCMRNGDADAGATATAGHDDCDKGFFCSSIGSLRPDFSERHCRSFCTTDRDCKATPQGKCMSLAAMMQGLCVPTCTPLGVDCPMGLDCSNLVGDFAQMNFLPTCRAPGKVAAGKSCSAATDCVAGTVCIDPTGMQGPTKCTPLCDAMHPCMTGQCAMAPGLPNMGGVCQ